MSSEAAGDLSSLIQGAKQGDMDAQDGLIRQYQKRIAAFLYAMSGRSELVEDLAQTVFIKMVLALPKLKEADRFESWLFRLARNVYLDHYRRERLRRFFVPFLEEHEQVSTPVAPGSERLEGLAVALQELPPNQRELLVLLQEREWSYEELAVMTNSTVGAVKSRLFRARTELKRLLPYET
ncbi:MAG: hypothetical protein B9S32_07895 [Verrucomicrobia bacterium Tous-C9LFEB]|nr:MAG: hypothetical protein B9S32_07895 [Verrucomicrobia bacterium Tous-C9LFEB]